MQCDLCPEDIDGQAIGVTGGSVLNGAIPDFEGMFLPDDRGYRLHAHETCWEKFVEAGWKAFTPKPLCPLGCGHKQESHRDRSKMQTRRRNTCQGTVRRGDFSVSCECEWTPESLQAVK